MGNLKIEMRLLDNLPTPLQHTKEELADILDVIYAICEFKNISKEDIEILKQQKSEKRGGFKRACLCNVGCI